MGEAQRVELDDYGCRPDGSRNLWVVRLVKPPISDGGHDALRHGGLIVARSCGKRSDAVYLARYMCGRYRVQLQLGARFVIEPAFYSRLWMPGARRIVFSDDDLARGRL